MITILIHGQSNAVFLAANSTAMAALIDFVEAETGQEARFLSTGEGGQALSYFTKGNAGYTNFMADIAAANPSIAGDQLVMLWKHGESGLGQAGYASTFDQILDDTVADLGITRAQFPVFIGGLATNTNDTGSYTDANWSARQSDLYQCAALENCYWSHSDQDATLVDDAHYDSASYVRCARRFGQAIADYFGTEPNPANFFVTRAAIASATTTKVQITQKLGTDFTPSEDITGFEVSENGLTGWTAAPGVRLNARELLLTHDSLSTSGRYMRHGYGLLAAVNLKDNSSLEVPLNFTPTNIQNSPLFATAMRMEWV